MKEPTLRDWVLYVLAAGFLGGLLGMVFSVTSWWFWLFDIPILFWLNWWFLYRIPKEKSLVVNINCAHFMCKSAPVENDDYCELHKI